MFVSLLKWKNYYSNFSFSLSKQCKSLSFAINYFRPNLILSFSRVLVYNFIVRKYKNFFSNNIYVNIKKIKIRFFTLMYWRK